MIIVCTICQGELKDQGGLLFSPPSLDTKNSNTGQNVLKYHFCKDCYEEILEHVIILVGKKRQSIS
jgi:hypothetical protein